MINKQKIIKNDLHFGLIFFNLLIRWPGDKLESLLSLLKVYSDSTKKRVYSRVNSQNTSELVNS